MSNKMNWKKERKMTEGFYRFFWRRRGIVYIFLKGKRENSFFKMGEMVV